MSESSDCRLSVVIPAFNEASRLPQTLKQIDFFFLEARELNPSEIIVVDDGSSDETYDVAGAFQPSSDIVVRRYFHQQNRGKGAAVRTGFRHSQGRQVLLSDADLAAPMSGLFRLLSVSSETTIVIGSRAIDRSLLLKPQPFYRDLMGRTFNLLVRALLLPGILDTQCGFKLFPGQVARSLAMVQKIDGFAFDVELLTLARFWNLIVVELGVPWGHVEASRVLPMKHSVEMFRDLLRITSRCWSRSLPSSPGVDLLDV